MTPLIRITVVLLAGALLSSIGNPALSQRPSDEPGAATLSRREWRVDGANREALVWVPASAATAPTPVVFAFHGHGGTMRNAANAFRYHEIWPDAIAVYMQGLNTPGRLTDPEGRKPGWQAAAGEQQDRDLKFFDAVLGTLEKSYKVDKRRVYSAGHSNGGGFTYLLWATRGEVLAAVAPSAAVGARSARFLKPKPVLHVAGERDELVKFAWQQQQITFLRRLNGCGDGQPWAEGCTQYPSTGGTPVVTFVHPGTHKFPSEAPRLIVRFFREHPMP